MVICAPTQHRKCLENMNYILLDLEWNQAYFEQSQAVQKRLGTRLRGEVIQIGAVKLSEDLAICGSFSVIVKPKYFRRIHRHVMQLTGITQEMIDRGMLLEEAADRFRRFCGEDSVLLTWGPDDVPMFTDNLRANDLPVDWVPPVYDLQIIYNMQTDGSSRQRSLEYAMEQMGIEQHLPAHDALNDAYFTALVAAKLNIQQGILQYSDRRGQYLDVLEIGNADVGEKGFATAEQVVKESCIDRLDCPLCKKKMEKAGKLLHEKGQRYKLLYICDEHGKMMASLRLVRNLNGTLRGKRTISQATDEAVRIYLEKLSRTEVVKTAKRRRHHRGHGKGKAASSGATQTPAPSPVGE